MKRKEYQSQLVRNVRAICERYGIEEPSQFLAKVMAGQDPRHLSQVYSEAKALHEQHQTSPCPICGDKYIRLLDIILMNERYHHNPVEFTASLLAAKELMVYMYPKLRSVEHSGTVEVPVIPRMTEEERKEFFEKVRTLQEGAFSADKVES